MMVLLNDALLPNLVQTGEGAPAHRALRAVRQHRARHEQRAGAAHGPAPRRLRRQRDRLCGRSRRREVLRHRDADVRTRAVGGGGDRDAEGAARAGRIARRPGGRGGFPNLERHLDNLRAGASGRSWRSTAFPATPTPISRRCSTSARRSASRRRCRRATPKGGDGMTDLARQGRGGGATAPTRRRSRRSTTPTCRSRRRSPTIATKVYGAEGVAFKPAARARLQQFAALGYGHLPVCIAKTQYSFTDDPR